MKKGDYLSAILNSPKTVFSAKDIFLIWQDSGSKAARVRLSYYLRKGKLFHLRKGLYVKNMQYSKFELATKIFRPSYISFETVLLQEGVIFQPNTSISIASYLTRSISIKGSNYAFRKIKNEILVNEIGINIEDETSKATKERAILDTLYLNKDYFFDNLRDVDWQKIDEILPIYGNKRMEKIISKLKKDNS